MIGEQIKKLKSQIEKSISKLEEDLQSLRTGRARIGLVENILVSYYGTEVPLKKLAQITVPSPDKIVIIPFDKSALGDIETAIKESNLDLAPVNDGKNIRLNLPSLTEERRKEIVKLVHTKVEETRIAIRNMRRQVWDLFQKMEQSGKITEDDKYTGQDELNKLISEFNDKIDDISQAKEKEILKV